MPDQCLTPDALRLCPTCLRSIAIDSDQLDDSVHRFVRLMACYEVLIKLLGNAAHAVQIDRGCTPTYLEEFERQFVSKRPSLGDWLQLLQKAAKKLAKGGPPWLAPAMRWLRDGGKTESAISRLGQFVGSARQILPSENAIKAHTGLEALERAVELRNAFGHGALTPRFADRYVKLLAAALEELVIGLRIGELWRFRVPIRFDPANPKQAVSLDPEDPDAGTKQILLGERSTQPEWGSLYVGSSKDSFEDFVRLGPMIRYEKTLRDYFFLNRFGDGVVEHLSYRSGDFELRGASQDWRAFFGLELAVLPETELVETPVAETSTSPCPTTQSIAAANASTAQSSELVASSSEPIATDLPGPSVRDVLATFTELGERQHDPDWIRLQDDWERKLAPLSDDSLTQLFLEMKKCAAQARHPDSLLLFLGNMEQRMEFHEEAVQQFKELSDKFPDNPTKKSRYGQALLVWGSQLKAEGKAQQNSMLFDKGKEVLGQAKETLIASLYDEPDTAMKKWQNVRALSLIVDACCRRGEFDDAAKFSDAGLKLEPTNPRLISQRQFIHETLKK